MRTSLPNCRADRPVNTGTHSGRSALITCSTARSTAEIVPSYGTSLRSPGSLTLGIPGGGGGHVAWDAVDDETRPDAHVITVFLVDDHEVVRRGVAEMLNEEP